MNNGSSTGYFYRERGTCQGNPISAYLFILALEILFIHIRDNHHIKGIMIDKKLNSPHMQMMETS